MISSNSQSHWSTERHWALKPKLTTFSIFLVLQSRCALLSPLTSLLLGSRSSTLHNSKGFPEMTKSYAWPLQWQLKDSKEDLLFNRQRHEVSWCLGLWDQKNISCLEIADWWRQENKELLSPTVAVWNLKRRLCGCPRITFIDPFMFFKDTGQ